MSIYSKNPYRARLSISLTSTAIILLSACSDSGNGIGSSTVTPANTEERACLLEASFTILNETLLIKDCAQSDGSVSNVDLRQYCESLSAIGVQLGATPAKITYMKSCPANPQGSCYGATILPSGITGYYYARTDIDATKASCENTGGTWK